MPKRSNHLIQEKSPYLQQHAHNPVDWFPWGDEALEKSRRENLPIFLSIGYATCHWCHVMERESFENEALAQMLNQGFVSIKVDREERPDLDAYYMKAVMAMTGSGGWPMSVFLTPDLKPFYGGTYFPPEDRWGRPGFKTLLSGIDHAWKNRREEILKNSSSLAEALQTSIHGGSKSSGLNIESLMTSADRMFKHQFDPEHGGFGGAPKFPSAHALSFLLRRHYRTGDPELLRMAVQTLESMAAGGLCDPLGGGFHRYSTDARWFLPHFEKMLYDQALLARAYAEAYQITKNEMFAQTARNIFDYVLRDMAHPEGGFYSAEDADSLSLDGSGEKKEGAFYLWPWEELESVLGPERFPIYQARFGMKQEGNIQEDPHQEMTGGNHLYEARSLEDLAAEFKRSKEEIQKILQEGKEILFKIRTKRPRPFLDDKILTDWNALMISSLALGARILDEPKYLLAASRSAEFILKNLKGEGGFLYHRWRDGQSAIPAFLDDYAFFAEALLDLYETSFEIRWLEEAIVCVEKMHELFRDPEGGAYYLSEADPQSPGRIKEFHDGAIPSGNSAAVSVLYRLSRLLGRKEFEVRAGVIFQAMSGPVSSAPISHAYALSAVDFGKEKPIEIVLSGDLRQAQTQEILKEMNRIFLPGSVRLFISSDPVEFVRMEKLSALVVSRCPIAGQSMLYICHNQTCDLPMTKPSEIASALASL